MTLPDTCEFCHMPLTPQNACLLSIRTGHVHACPDCAAAHAATCRDEAEDIMALAYESAVAGDLEQDAICRLAVAGDEAALAECHRVLADAQAQED